MAVKLSGIDWSISNRIWICIIDRFSATHTKGIDRFVLSCRYSPVQKGEIARASIVRRIVVNIDIRPTEHFVTVILVIF